MYNKLYAFDLIVAQQIHNKSNAIEFEHYTFLRITDVRETDIVSHCSHWRLTISWNRKMRRSVPW